MNDIPLGKYLSEAIDPSASQAEHFMKCETCGGWIDCCDLGSVFGHEGPLPHPDRTP